MKIGSGEHTYEWVENWAKVPDSSATRLGWSHHGIVASKTGDMITYHQEDGTVLRFSAEGELKSTWKGWFEDAHGITLVEENGIEYLWIADNGRKRLTKYDYEYPAGTPEAPIHGQVVKTTLQGEEVVSLSTPPLPIYRDADYMPTWVAVNEERNGGNGDIWVADGYGQHHVHRYDKRGNFLLSINGLEGNAGAFNTPHAIFFDFRKGNPELYIADRSNGRVQVYDAEGNFIRVFGEDFMTSPSGFATHGTLMVVAELKARLLLLDGEDRLVIGLGGDPEVADTEGWPNDLDETGKPIRPKSLASGKFNSPHGMAVDADGNIYIAEWLVGGRHIKLAK